jgi:hypothetical protein
MRIKQEGIVWITDKSGRQLACFAIDENQPLAATPIHKNFDELTQCTDISRFIAEAPAH